MPSRQLQQQLEKLQKELDRAQHWQQLREALDDAELSREGRREVRDRFRKAIEQGTLDEAQLQEAIQAAQQADAEARLLESLSPAEQYARRLWAPYGGRNPYRVAS